ncbi:hypothetical protein K402DRAFT_408347 [Aulographum hederae CBS 113979]|uniref:F-box domain-containing protein n=1 Tax=Aulographum hederae CBS 113979 TaxID=1176131 RepID=A0A6G1GL44_9PEZI|nr:hypothetical protein K402DRAFT_408347 [Aulographum hederae CBS 113979]
MDRQCFTKKLRSKILNIYRQIEDAKNRSKKTLPCPARDECLQIPELLVLIFEHLPAMQDLARLASVSPVFRGVIQAYFRSALFLPSTGIEQKKAMLDASLPWTLDIDPEQAHYRWEPWTSRNNSSYPSEFVVNPYIFGHASRPFRQLRMRRYPELRSLHVFNYDLGFKVSKEFSAGDRRFLLKDVGWWREMQVCMPGIEKVGVYLEMTAPSSPRPFHIAHTTVFCKEKGGVKLKHIAYALQGNVLEGDFRRCGRPPGSDTRWKFVRNVECWQCRNPEHGEGYLTYPSVVTSVDGADFQFANWDIKD